MPVGGAEKEEDNDVLYVKRNKIIYLSRSMRRVYETIMKVVVI
jgi:hypothetical protein